MDGSHPDVDPVPNTHHVSVDWTRHELALQVPLGGAWDALLEVPYDLKSVKARYTLPDGTPFANPEGDLHHRTERLDGFGDLRIGANLQEGPWRFTFGLSLPTARTYADPYERGLLGLPHQHIQGGSGTFDPYARISWFTPLGERFALDAGAGVQATLYENRHGYRAPSSLDLVLGPRWSPAPWIAISAKYSLLYQTRGYWDGDPDPNTRYLMSSLIVAAPIRLPNRWTLLPTYTKVLDVRLPEGGDSFDLEWIASLGLEIPLGAAPK